jgi:hypothetical protein
LSNQIALGIWRALDAPVEGDSDGVALGILIGLALVSEVELGFGVKLDHELNKVLDRKQLLRRIRIPEMIPLRQVPGQQEADGIFTHGGALFQDDAIHAPLGFEENG